MSEPIQAVAAAARRLAGEIEPPDGRRWDRVRSRLRRLAEWVEIAGRCAVPPRADDEVMLRAWCVLADADWSPGQIAALWPWESAGRVTQALRRVRGRRWMPRPHAAARREAAIAAALMQGGVSLTRAGLLMQRDESVLARWMRLYEPAAAVSLGLGRRGEVG